MALGMDKEEFNMEWAFAQEGGVPWLLSSYGY
jgi:hypothetical protein